MLFPSPRDLPNPASPVPEKPGEKLRFFFFFFPKLINYGKMIGLNIRLCVYTHTDTWIGEQTHK